MVYIIVIVLGIIWGFATMAVISNKGYSENWFWWGFFFGFVAFLVACSKPEVHSPSTSSAVNVGGILHYAEEARINDLLKNGGWKCPCGRIHPAYEGTCSCGRSKFEILEKQKNDEKIAISSDALENTKIIGAYKQLLDLGAITQEEYDKKKMELLQLH